MQFKQFKPLKTKAGLRENLPAGDMYVVRRHVRGLSKISLSQGKQAHYNPPLQHVAEAVTRDKLTKLKGYWHTVRFTRQVWMIKMELIQGERIQESFFYPPLYVNMAKDCSLFYWEVVPDATTEKHSTFKGESVQLLHGW